MAGLAFAPMTILARPEADSEFGTEVIARCRELGKNTTMRIDGREYWFVPIHKETEYQKRLRYYAEYQDLLQVFKDHGIHVESHFA